MEEIEERKRKKDFYLLILLYFLGDLCVLCDKVNLSEISSLGIIKLNDS